MTTLYGIKTCDTCRKAAKALQVAGQTVTFRDIRADPLDDVTLAQFLDAFGMALVNTRSTTWRALTEAERAEPPMVLLRSHPTLMKRPVIEGRGGLTLGWKKDAHAAQLG